MGVLSIWGVGASAFAALFGFIIGRRGYALACRREVASSLVSTSKAERIILRLQKWSRPFDSLSTELLKIKPIREAADNAKALLGDLGISLSKQVVISISISMGVSALVTASLLSRSLVFGIAFAVVLLVGAAVFSNNRRQRMEVEMRESVPEALRALEACFRSGQSLLQTLGHAAQEIGGGLGRLFSIAARRLEMGETTTEALSILRSNRHIPELSFVAVALDVQHQSGGSVVPILNAARESVESELELTRSLRIQTAQARLSASIVTLMPFVLVAFFSLMSPDFLSPFFGSLIGMALLALALVMQITGVLVVRHMLRIETE